MAAGVYEFIGKVSPANATTNSIAFTNIPQTYKHLEIIGVLEASNVTNERVYITLNGPGEFLGLPSPLQTRIDNNGSTAYLNSSGTNPFGYSGNQNNQIGAFRMVIPNYTGSLKKIGTFISSGSGSSPNGSLGIHGITTENTSITKLVVYMPGGYYWSTRSFISIYGIKE
jgi:hypothetical protein